MLEHITDNLISAGPLIIFGSFVFVCLAHIIPDNEELERKSQKKHWTEKRLRLEKEFSDVLEKVLSPFVILGVCFGLAFVWSNNIWILLVSLGCMSTVGLILFSPIIKIPFFVIQEYNIKFTLEKKMDQSHPNK